MEIEIEEKHVSMLEDRLNNALKEKSEIVSGELVEVEMSTATHSMNLTTVFKIDNSLKRKGNIMIANLSWKSLSIKDEIEIGGFDFNKIGKNIRPYIENLTVYHSYYENGTRLITKEMAMNSIGNLTVYDLSSLQ